MRLTRGTFVHVAGVAVFDVEWGMVLDWAWEAGYALDERPGGRGLPVAHVEDARAFAVEWRLAGCPGLRAEARGRP